ncbi:MAG: response regulator [Anaerolineae bacterium]|nr:response regulator [Anaerolineae bacterium]
MADSNKIRVMIVDDIADTREYIRRSLQFDSNIEVIALARNGTEAIQMAQENKPDVVIMDINMPDMDGITATEAIRRKVPHTQVIILSVQSDPSYMRRAMLVGARDFLTKPPSIDELLAAIRRAGKMADDEKAKIAQQAISVQAALQSSQGKAASETGKIILVYSPKGGTGCTTIAANLSLALISDERKCVLVDGGMQFGDVAVFLNEQPKNNVTDLTVRVEDLDPEVVEGVLIKHAASGLRVLPAPPKPEMAEKTNGEQFAKMLKFLRGIYSYVVVDTASYLTEFVQSAIEVADIIVLITTQDIPSIKNSSLFLSLVDAVGINRQKIIFVMNKYDKRISITPEKIGENLKQEVSLAIPFEERIAISAVNRGMPFYLENKTNPLSKAIASLADITRERIKKNESPA